MTLIDPPTSPNIGDIYDTRIWDGRKWQCPALLIDAPKDGRLWARQNGTWQQAFPFNGGELLALLIDYDLTVMGNATFNGNVEVDGNLWFPWGGNSIVFTRGSSGEFLISGGDVLGNPLQGIVGFYANGDMEVVGGNFAVGGNITTFNLGTFDRVNIATMLNVGGAGGQGGGNTVLTNGGIDLFGGAGLTTNGGDVFIQGNLNVTGSITSGSNATSTADPPATSGGNTTGGGSTATIPSTGATDTSVGGNLNLGGGWTINGDTGNLVFAVNGIPAMTLTPALQLVMASGNIIT